jgi:sRNA-binding protein
LSDREALEGQSAAVLIMSHAEQRHAQAAELAARLKAEHPVLKHANPLDETTVEADLLAAHPDLAPWLLRLALHQHLTGDAYLQSLAHGGPRYRLDGEPAGEVDSETRLHARLLLKHHRAHRHRDGG